MIRILLKKELKSYFNSPVAYIVLIVFLGVSGWFFVQDLFASGRADISGFLSVVPFLYLLIIPGLSMRLIAEERSRGTIEVLSTMPVRNHEIIIGKWLAAVVLMSLGLFMTLLYPITVGFLGDVDWGTVFTSYLGFFLLSLFFVAIGIFTSSLTSSQIIAFIIGIIISFFFFIIGKLLIVIPTPLVSFFSYLGIDHHLNNLIKGIVDSRDVIYFLSLTGAFLFGALYFVGKIKERIFNVTYSVLVGVIIILVNIISQQFYVRSDFTEGGIYSLGRASIDMVRALPDNVIVKAYITSELPFPYHDRALYINDMLAEYRQHSGGRIKIEHISPQSRDEILDAKSNGVMPLQFTEVSQTGMGIKQVFMGLVFLYRDRREVMPVVENLAHFEYDVTSRIKRLVAQEIKTIGFTTEHDEIQATDQLLAVVRRQYRTQAVDLKDTIPLTCDALVIPGPRTDFDEEELKKVRTYLENGGPVAFLLDAFTINFQLFRAFPRKLQNLHAFIASYGIAADSGMIMDPQNEMMAIRPQQGEYTMQNYTTIPYPYFVKATHLSDEHPVTRDLDLIIMPFVQPVAGGNEIAFSTEDSWLRLKPESLNPMDTEKFLGFPLPIEQKGRFNMISTATGDVRLLVSGTAKYIDPNFINPPGMILFMNILDWLTQDEMLITTRSKVVTDRPLKNIGSGMRLFLRWFITLFPSLILVIVGIITWRLRKKEKVLWQ